MDYIKFCEDLCISRGRWSSIAPRRSHGFVPRFASNLMPDMRRSYLAFQTPSNGLYMICVALSGELNINTGRNSRRMLLAPIRRNFGRASARSLATSQRASQHRLMMPSYRTNSTNSMLGLIGQSPIDRSVLNRTSCRFS